MALNKRILNKIHDKCEGDEAMIGFMYEIVRFEFDEPKQYTKFYEDAIKKYAKQSEGNK